MKTTFPLDKPFSVLIPDGESFFALPVVQCLGQIENVRIYVLSNNRTAAIRFSRYTTKYFIYPAGEGDAGRLAAMLRIVKEKKIDIVLTIDEPTIRFLSENGGELLKYTLLAPYPKAETFDNVVDKWKFANWLKAHNIPYPTTILYQTGPVFDEELLSIKFPALIKPARGNGGIGIMFFDDSESLKEYCQSHIQSGEYIVQSFVEGYDLGCSILSKEGVILATTMQKRSVNTPLTFSPFTNIDFLFDRDINELIENIIKELNWSGVAHFDLRYDEVEKQVKVLEINARFWQSVPGSFYAGVNFPYLATLVGLNRELPPLNFQPIHYVNPKTAVKLLAQKYIYRKSEIQEFGGSKLEMHLKDPLPLIMTRLIQWYKRIVG
ncbi:MAG: ATP-grasp domain-containing protein [Prolixibacteraceae bacterium]